jgi:zinc/manganese transport system substrate-binding protein
MLRRFLIGFLCLLLVLPAAAQDALLNVVATTTILADVAHNVGGDLVNVTPLLPPDTDTHAYEPTTDDAARVAQADMLLTVGAGYEAFITRLLENVGGGVNTVEVSQGLAILPLGLLGHEHQDEQTPEATAEADGHEAEGLGVLGEGLECAAHEHEEGEAAADEHGQCDPHVWMNPQNVIGWVNNIVDAFSAADPDNAAAYRANGDAYITQLQALDAEIAGIVAAIPEDRRILLTNHEFMGYFAHHYGFEVVATVLPGANTSGEVDPQSLAALIALVQQEHVPAIFAEVSANPQIADVIASESGVAVVTSLYSESLGPADSPASTYTDFMRYNAQTIAGALAAAE